jgi:SAM-dependent methyltransferase
VSHEDVRDFIDRGWRHWETIDAALADGRMTEDEWYAAIQAVLVPAYLNATNPRAQSGHSGDEAGWEQARGLAVEAIDRDGTFLDVGCANGHLMESVQQWASQRGYHIEPYGLDLSPDLVRLARSRLPGWDDRFWIGNGLDWVPPFRFDFVHLQELEYVPRKRRRTLVAHLLGEVCREDGRLLIGPTNELRANGKVETSLLEWGFVVGGKLERPGRHPEVVRRLIWVNSSAR